MRQKTLFVFRRFLPLVLLAAWTATLSAAPISFTFEGVFSGSLDGVSFTDEAYVFSALADTNNIAAFSNGIGVVHDSATLQLLGSTLSIATTTSTYVNHAFGLTGFSNDERQYDLLIGPFDPVFETWDMLTSLGPITSLGFLSSAGARLDTTGGLLLVTDAENQDITFTASTPASEVPEPSTGVLLFGSIVAAALWLRWPKRGSSQNIRGPKTSTS